MFSSKDHIARRTGLSGTSRLQYFQDLIHTFQKTETQPDEKSSIICHLSNFAYDPLNYEDLRSLNIVDLFVDVLSEDDPVLACFGMAGLSNCCIDEENAKIIVENDGIQAIIKCLTGPKGIGGNEKKQKRDADNNTNHGKDRTNLKLYAITTLYYINHFLSKDLQAELKTVVEQLAASTSDRQLKNIANIFLEEID